MASRFAYFQRNADVGLPNGSQVLVFVPVRSNEFQRHLVHASVSTDTPKPCLSSDAVQHKHERTALSVPNVAGTGPSKICWMRVEGPDNVVSQSASGALYDFNVVRSHAKSSAVPGSVRQPNPLQRPAIIHDQSADFPVIFT